jgi:hypothetical protein
MRFILHEGIFSYFEGIFCDHWAIDELLVSLPDEDGHTIIVDIDVSEEAASVSKVVEVKGECMMIAAFKVVHILFENLTSNDAAGIGWRALKNAGRFILIKRHLYLKAFIPLDICAGLTIFKR